MRRFAAVLLSLCLLCVQVFAAGDFLDGIYYGMGKGRNGWISVSVSVDSGRISAVEVDAPQETPGKLGQALQIVEHMIGLGDLESVQNVDAISGATGSSEGIKSAVLNALQSALPKWLHGEAEDCPGAAFTDLPSYGSWAHIPIDWAVTTGVTSGTSETSFSPNSPCTRAQIVTFLWRAAGRPACREPNAVCSDKPCLSADERGSSLQPKEAEPRIFSDVPADAWYYDAVLWAVETGITNGTSETTFSPNAKCTRAQAVTFLWRAAGSSESVADGSPVPVILSASEESKDSSSQAPQNDIRSSAVFSDVPSTVYYYDAVLWAVGNGITQGVSETEFAPNQPCTRAQIVTFLFRARLLPEVA